MNTIQMVRQQIEEWLAAQELYCLFIENGDNCWHKYILDLVDLGGDRYKYVRYCELCYKTQNIK